MTCQGFSKLDLCLLYFQTATEPSAPSCDLLDLSPSTPNHRATLEEVNAMNAQLSDLSKQACRSVRPAEELKVKQISLVS